jgi:hypothetical protein
MTRKNIQEINFHSDQERKSKAAVHKKGMPIVRCICGSKILLVPDLKAMNRTIKNRLAEHKQADDGLAFDSLEEFLTEQILMAAAK